MSIRNNNWTTPEVHLSWDALGPFSTGLQSEHMMSYCQDSPGPNWWYSDLLFSFPSELCHFRCVDIYISLGHGRLSTGGSLWEPPAPLSHSTQSVIRQPKRSVLFHIVLCHDIFTINAIFVISNAALNTIWRHTSDWKTVKGSWRLQTCWEVIWRESLQKHQNHDELQQM